MRDDNFHKLLRPFFDDTTLQRGLDYARRGLVRVTSTRTREDATQIQATCDETSPEPYEQRMAVILVSGRVANVLDTHCTCPMSSDCKHVVAAITTWLDSQQEHSTLLDPTPTDAVATATLPSVAVSRTIPMTRLLAVREPALTLGHDLEAWLRDTEDRVKVERAAPPAEVVLYSLEMDPARLAVWRVRRRKDGSNTKPVAVDVRSHFFEGDRAPRYANADDLDVIRLLRGTEVDADESEAGPITALDGVIGYAILERALRTGRLFWQSPQSSITQGERREGHFAWNESPTKALLLTVETPAGPVRALPTSPLTYFVADPPQIGELSLPVPEALVRQLLRLPAIESSVQSHFFAHWRRLQSQGGERHPLPDPPATVAVEPPARPQIVLKLATAEFEVYAGSRTRREVRPVAEAVVRYPSGAEFDLTDDVPFVSSWRSDGEVSVVTRHVDAERAALANLQEIGLIRNAPWGFGVRRNDTREYWTIGDGSNERWRAAIPSVLARADAAGVVLEFDPTFPFRVEEPEAWDEEFESVDAGGWFSLEIGITVNGERVTIAKSLAAWLARHHDPIGFLKASGEGRFILLDLPGGGLVKLPVERVRALLSPLLEFGVPEVGKDGRFRVSRLDAALHAGLGSRGNQLAADLEGLRGRLGDAARQMEADPSPTFNATLRPYQRVGLAWLQFLRDCRFGGVLADDMGLGKTVQALAHLQLEKQSGRAVHPNLVVTPTSVLPNWRAEANRFAPDLRVLILHGKDRAAQFAKVPDVDLVLTTYALLPRDGVMLTKQDWNAVIFDEAQFLKNPSGRAREVASRLRATHRIALTGTPVENNLRELWSLFDLALPGLLGGHDRFVRLFRTPIERERDTDRLETLKRRIRPFLVRRRREEVLGELPPRTEIVQKVELENAQRDLYESLRITLDSSLRRAIAERGLAQSQIMILDALLKLRQTCCDPRLVKTPNAKKAHGESAKLAMLKEMIEELVAEGRHALVFSQFASMIELIEAELAAMGVRYEKIVGDTPLAERELAVQRFQAGEADVFLISLRAGGTGLNLTAADTVIHYDPWWNPAVEAQATARAHRIGQDKSVFVFKLIASGTVEERILELLARKQALADSILDGGEAKGALITEEDIDALLAPIG